MTSKRKEEFLILVIALSYLSYNVYWFMMSANWVLSFILMPRYEPPTGLLFTNTFSVFMVYLMDFAAFFGLTVRFVGGLFALLSVYLIVGIRKNKGTLVKKAISTVLVCEALYFLSLVPSIFFLLGFSALSPLSNYLLSAQLFVEVLLISPFLIILAIKIRKLRQLVDKRSIVNWTGFLFLTYVLALWIAYLLKWSDLLNGANITFSNAFTWLLGSSRFLSLLNTTVTLTLAVIFAILGTKFLIRKNSNKTIKYWSLSATFLGAFFIFYVLYCIYLGVLLVIPFGEIWIIPFFAFGVYFLLAKDRNNRLTTKALV